MALVDPAVLEMPTDPTAGVMPCYATIVDWLVAEVDGDNRPGHHQTESAEAEEQDPPSRLGQAPRIRGPERGAETAGSGGAVAHRFAKPGAAAEFGVFGREVEFIPFPRILGFHRRTLAANGSPGAVDRAKPRRPIR